MISSPKDLRRLGWIGLCALILVAGLVASCKKRGAHTGSYPGPDFAMGVELSKIPGVSIVRVEPYYPASYSGKRGSARLEAQSRTLGDLIPRWCGLDADEIVRCEAALPDAEFDILIIDPADQSASGLAERAFAEVFNLNFLRSEKLMPIYRLRKKQGAVLELEPSNERGGGTDRTPDGFGYRFSGYSMPMLVDVISKYASAPVYDETGLTEEYYRGMLSMDHWEPKTVFAGVEKMGLELVPDKKMMSVLEVTNAAKK